MSNPIVENITANIAASIGQITEANGFNQTLNPVRQRGVDFGKLTWDDLTVLIVQGGTTAQDTQPIGLQAWDQKYLLVAFVIDGDNSEDPIDTRKNQVAADIEKKLMEDVHRGDSGHCWGTKILQKTPWQDSGAKSSGVAIELECEFRTQKGNPYA